MKRGNHGKEGNSLYNKINNFIRDIMVLIFPSMCQRKRRRTRWKNEEEEIFKYRRKWRQDGRFS